ncbi:hypothetical protein G6F68_020259 [Rhizopus microsporus]|nr:hypothetical protein G6F68_020259 [Rhizopus microsporus]
MFSTEDDQAARLSELVPVGSWTEVVIHGGPRQAQVDPGMSLKGWVSMGDDRAATVAEARSLHGCNGAHRSINVCNIHLRARLAGLECAP